MSISPYAAADKPKLCEIKRLAESRLEAQLTLGIAADQRAMTLASFLATLDAALIALLAVGSSGQRWSLVALMIGFGLATAVAAFSAQPVSWAVPGGLPADWIEDIASGDTLHNGNAAMLEYYQDMIVSNDQVLSKNGDLLRASFALTILTLFVAGFLALIG